MLSPIVMAFQALAANKLRAALTMLGNIIGVTCVIALWNIGESGRAYMSNAVASFGQNLIFIRPNYNVDENEQGKFQFHPLSLKDVDAIEENCPSVEDTSPVLMFQSNVSEGPRSHMTRIEGCFPSYLRIRQWKVASGASFSGTDAQERVRVALIGSFVASELFPGRDPVGERIRIDKTPFTVIGVLESKGSVFGQNFDDILLMPYQTLADCMGQGRNIHMIFCSARTRDGIEKAKSEIRGAVRESQKILPGRKDPIHMEDQGEMLRMVDGVLVGATMLLGAIACISLLVGGIGIMNIMLVSVTERTREIGLRMALGASDANILIQFLIEAMVLSAVGGAIGAGMGLGVSALAVKILSLITKSDWPMVFSLVSVAVALVFSMFVGIFFGFYPAWRASRLDPIVALRRE
ncbi:MAG TPA: ABC transporter permease [Planctomycetota bacterium]|nr:ABC transporter permease [Planctomycetota bacterium]